MSVLASIYHLIIIGSIDGLDHGSPAVDSAGREGRYHLSAAEDCRGNSNGDAADLNRRNIPGFDVRDSNVPCRRT